MALGSANPLLLATAASGGGSEEGSGGASDPVTRSLRFDGSAYLSRSTGSTSTTWTLSFWVKRATISGPSQAQYFATWGISGSAGEGLSFRGTTDSSNTDKLMLWNGATSTYSTGVYRDPSAWAHICISVNSGTATVYYNGESIISGVSGVQAWGSMRLGAWLNQNELEGYMADVYGVEDSALDHTSFTESNNYGGLKPKAFTGVGTNGFHLLFENTSSIGEDDAGSNDFTAANLSSHDVMLDVPTNNYCLINPLAETKTASDSYDANPTTGLSEGNLKLTSSQYFFNGHGTFGVSSGKWYFEWYSTGDWVQGGYTTHGMYSSHTDTLSDYWALYNQDSSNNINATYKDGSTLAAATWAGGSQASGNGNVFGCAFDVDNRKMYFHKNGEWSDGTSTLTSTFPSSYGGDLTGSSHNIPDDTTFFPIVRPWTNSTVIANFGQDSTFANTVASGSANAADANGNGDFRYTPPSGYLALCTASLSDPSVTPSEHFNTVLYNGTYDSYTGTGTSSQSITGVGFSPDICWIKDRDNQADYSNSYYGHYWFDTVLGTGSAINIDVEQGLSGSLNSGEDGISSFDSDGFTVDEAEETNFLFDDGMGYTEAERYVAWCWKLGTTASSWSGSGQDPDSEQYNSDAGMSIINYYDYDGNGTSIEFNHSLGAAPEFAIALDYEGYNSANYVWHKDLSSGNYLELSGNASQTSDSTYFPSSPATNTTFTAGVSLVDSIQTHIALFRSVEGFSKFGKYTGGSNPFIYTGFRVGFWMVKRIDSSGHWTMFDSARDTHNLVDHQLEPNYSNAESTNSTKGGDFLSNGFKVRSSQNEVDATGGTYVYAAFAESPLKYANAK